MADALVVHTEVEFLPLDQGQPLFADIDAFLREAGFQFHMFGHIAKRTVRPLSFTSKKLMGINQAVWADAIYIRDLSTLDTLAAERQLLMAALLHELYGSVDVAAHIIEGLSQRDPNFDAGPYMQRLVSETTFS